MTNLKLWDQFADIDPKFTKPITGKAYRGTSPNPQYVIRCLTELFGPVGQGFGWDVVAEEFTPLGGEVLHWCRIKFWHTDRANTFDSYGQTKAVYTTGQGKVIVDEDAPKKSLTDAIIKAASHVGIAANIFLGRWDDQKYVASVAAEYRAEEKAELEKPETQTSAALDQAWGDAILDRLPEGATAAQKADAFAEAIIMGFQAKGGIKALENEWARRSKTIAWIEAKFPALYNDLLDAYEVKRKALLGDITTPN